jgi:glycerophosphoryl diester phosphodiesterase
MEKRVKGRSPTEKVNKRVNRQINRQISIIAHRAINHINPENSLSAFEWAMRKGYSIELDVYLTKDGVPVISHDKNLERLFGVACSIPETSYVSLKKLRFKSDSTQSIPSFEEVCQLYSKIKPKNFFFCIQIKDMYQKNVMEKTYELVKKYALPKECFFFEVDKNAWPLVVYMKKNIPQMLVGLHLPENSPNYNEKDFYKMDVLWVDEITFDWMNKKMVDMTHKLGKKAYAISAELIPHSKNAHHYRRRWKDLINYGFDGICTDHPEELEIFLKSLRV